MVGQTTSVAMMDITDHGATKRQVAGTTVLSGSAKNVIEKVG